MSLTMADSIRNPALDGQSRFGEIVTILSVFSAISTIAVGMRCYARLFILRCFGRDDGVMVAAQVLTIGSAAAIGVEAHYGLGRHTWMVKQENLIPYMKAFYASIVVYNIAVCLTKVSILLQYKRLFSNRIMQQVTMFGLCFLVAWAVALAFLLTLICQPVAAFWDTTIRGRCLDAPTIWYIMAGVNLVSDFTILTLPMPVIKSLQLPTRQKFMLIAVFCLGFFPCAVSIYRIKTLRTAIDTQDPMYDNVDAATWSFLELTTGVLAACLPTLRPIFLAAMPRLFGNNGNSSSSSTITNLTNHSRGGGNGGNGGGGGILTKKKTRGGGIHSSTGGTITSEIRMPKLTYLNKSETTTARTGTSGSSSSEEEKDIGFAPALKSGSRRVVGGMPKAGGGGGGGYVVSVVAAAAAGEEDDDYEKEFEGGRGRGGAGIIKTTTVVTQQVSSSSSSGRTPLRGPAAGGYGYGAGYGYGRR